MYCVYESNPLDCTNMHEFQENTLWILPIIHGDGGGDLSKDKVIQENYFYSFFFFFFIITIEGG